VASDLDLLAASLRADSADSKTFVQVLAAKLAGAFPDDVRIERSGLFRKGDVERVEVVLGENRYRLELDGRRLHTFRARTVRGIVLKNEEIPVHDWIEDLSRDLAESAAHSELGRRALERLVHE
jgi:hypothetical protein